MELLKRFSIFEVGQKLQLDCDRAGGRGGGTSHPGLALGKFLTHRLAGENRRFFKQPGNSECVSS